MGLINRIVIAAVVLLAVLLAGCAESGSPNVDIEVRDAYLQTDKCLAPEATEECVVVEVRMSNTGDDSALAANFLAWNAITEQNASYGAPEATGPDKVNAGGTADVTLAWAIPTNQTVVAIEYEPAFTSKRISIPSYQDPEAGDGGSSGYKDNGDQVEDISLSLTEEDLDTDQQKEGVISISGTGTDDQGDEEYYRFGGTYDLTFERHTDAPCLGDPPQPISDFTGAFGPGQFTGSFRPSVEVPIDDAHLIDGEQYTIEGSVTVNKTEQTYTRSDEFLVSFSDDKENQPAPPPLDEAEGVALVEVRGTSDNRDSDAANELIVTVRGRPSDDQYAECRFNATISLTVEHKQGYGDDATYDQVGEWEYPVGTPDFESTKEFEAVLQDDNFQDGETYRLSVSVDMNATGERFDDTDTAFYSEG